MSATSATATNVPLRFWTPRFGRHKYFQLFLGTGMLVLIVLAVVLAPLLTSFDPTATDPINALAAPSAAHPLGTDNLGRDILSRLLYGGRADLFVASIAVLIPFVAGTAIGIVCGYFGGWIDAIVMRIADIVSAFPFYVLVIALLFVLGPGPSSIFIAISLVSWVAYARIVRAETLVVRSKEFIEAGRVGGIGTARILARHVAPNVVTQAIVYSMSDIVLNIGVIVTLSYFGLGIVPPTPDWGGMMADGQQFLAGGFYSLTLIPAGAVVLTSFALSLTGDGLARILRIGQ
jgi:peptide/nickel transport system permease protein